MAAPLMTGYKLFRLRRDGTLGPLFINRGLRIHLDVWYLAEEHPTPGYAVRPGWHICNLPLAPHLSTKNRVWCRVEFELRRAIQRPVHQGGLWYLGSRMRVLEQLVQEQVDHILTSEAFMEAA